MSMNDFNLCEHRELLATQLRAALAAVESNDSAALQGALASLAAIDERPLAQGVAKLAGEVHDAIRRLDLDSRLACLAGGEIQDASKHLDYVVRMTEEAAHRTLDLVDDSRGALDELSQRHAQLLTTADPEGGEALNGAVLRLRGNLRELAQAQEYQDLTGQLIRRVIALVNNVERALVDLLRAAGAPLKELPGQPITVMTAAANAHLPGPNAANASSQQDADALLADLGF